MQVLESLSMITLWKIFQLSQLNGPKNCRSFCYFRVYHCYVLVQAEWILPVASQAITAMDEKLFRMAASELNLKTWVGGGHHLALGALGWASLQSRIDRCSENLSSRPWIAMGMLKCESLCAAFFLSVQIHPRVRASLMENIGEVYFPRIKSPT